MSDLGELLELLHGARHRYTTARGVLRHRSSLRLTQLAHERWERQARAAGGHSVGTSYAMIFATGDEPPTGLPDWRETVVRFWSEPPARLREEAETAAPQPFEHVVVRDGERWWTYSPEWGAVSNAVAGEEEADTSPGGGELWGALLDPAALMPALDFEPGEEGELLGRAALHVNATARAARREETFLFRSQLPVGADEYHLVVDRERGVVLRAAALLDGEEFQVSALEELVFDDELPPETFVFEPPAGETVRAPEVGMHEPVTIEEAAARASFPVYLVPQLPEGRWELHVVHAPPRERPPVRESVHLAYHRSDARHHLTVTQTRAETREVEQPASVPGVEPETLERDGLSVAVYRPQRGWSIPLTIAFKRGETALQLSSTNLDEEILLDLAASMEMVV